jgi:hypothetical protein
MDTMKNSPETVGTASPADGGETEVTHLEMSGAIMSRMIHELSNLLAVLAGNLQLAGMVSQEPERLSRVMKSLHEASDSLGETVGRYAGFRRQLMSGAPNCPMTRLQEMVAQDLEAGFPGWRLLVPEPITVTVQADPRWIAHAVREVLALSQSVQGQVRLYGAGARFDPRGLRILGNLPQAPTVAHVLVTWPSAKPSFSDQNFITPQTLPLAVVIGLVRWANGQLSYGFFPPDENRFWISLLAGNE